MCKNNKKMSTRQAAKRSVLILNWIQSFIPKTTGTPKLKIVMAKSLAAIYSKNSKSVHNFFKIFQATKNVSSCSWFTCLGWTGSWKACIFSVIWLTHWETKQTNKLLLRLVCWEWSFFKKKSIYLMTRHEIINKSFHEKLSRAIKLGQWNPLLPKCMTLPLGCADVV